MHSALYYTAIVRHALPQPLAGSRLSQMHSKFCMCMHVSFVVSANQVMHIAIVRSAGKAPFPLHAQEGKAFALAKLYRLAVAAQDLE